MTNKEKIEAKKEKIAITQEKIEKEQAKIEKLKKEIETLESLEIKSMLKEIDMPLDQVVKLLKTMKPTPTVDPSNNESTGTNNNVNALN